METLYIVDGSGYIFRAYYAISKLSNSAGLPTNALYGFTRMLLKLLRDVEAKHIAVTFDTAAPTFRHELYEEYKANRAECPEDLSPQMPYFRHVVEALGIASLEQPGVEADDIIASLVSAHRNSNCKIIVVSGDKDLTQLVDSQVTVWDAMRDVYFTEEKVEEKFGVKPGQIVDYLSLVGDTSDNVPGIAGVGPKTATALIQNFGTIDALLGNLDKVEQIKGLRGARSVREKLENSNQLLERAKTLVTLKADVEPFVSMSDLEGLEWTGVNSDLALALFKELEFDEILTQLGISQSAVVQARAKNYRIIADEELESFVRELEDKDSFAFDTETTSLDVLTAELVGISISWEPYQACFLPLKHNSSSERCLSLERVRSLLGPVIGNPKIKKVGCNLKFDIGVLEEHGFKVFGADFDVMLASYVLHPDHRQHNLKAMAKKYLNEEMQTFEQMLGESSSILEVDLDRIATYAAADADISLRLKLHLAPLLLEPSPASGKTLDQAFRSIEMPLVAVLSQIERQGVKLDLDYLQQLEAEFAAELLTLEGLIHQYAGAEFNLNSPKQLQDILFNQLGISTTGVKKTKSGYSTDASVLHKLIGEHPIIEEILDYRELFKLQSTYVEALQRLVHPKTGRIHTSFNQAVAATGRLSSSDPNLQNIPIRNPKGRRLRNAFVAEHGMKLISADYSQIELRVLAHLSGDESLKRAFEENKDIHLTTAQQIFGTLAKDDAERAAQRRAAKTINFGIIYGMSGFRLAGELGISRSEADRYIAEYFARYPKVRSYYDALIQGAEEIGYVETIFGRRRFSKDIDSTGRDAGYVGRSLINAPIQGSSAEIIKRAMIKVAARLEKYQQKAQMVLQVHDELVFEVADDLVEELKNVIVEEMESAVELCVPLRVDSRVGRSWGSD